ncbi:MAG: neutral/alkaline non-lysosomal ceramidase N-terminal domain-containing protein [Candidatus Acidiferrum sp.]
MNASGKADRKSLGFFRLILIFVLSVLGTHSNIRAAQFRAAVVKVDITPEKPQWLLGYDPRQSTGVHDHLFHRIVAMDDGTTQFFLISTDVCLFSPSVYDDVSKEIEKQTGIKPLQIWWTVTHTHSAPEIGPPGLAGVFMGTRYEHDHNTAYTAWAKKALIEGIKDARAKLALARLGVGWGFARATINRRARDEEGPTYLGLNPYGPVDLQIGLLRLEKADGKLMALIANYAMHGTVLGPTNTQITGDAPGIVADYVEEKLGVPMLYINGAAGNVAPIYTVYPDFASGHLSQFRVLLGDRILEANARLGATTSEVKLSLGEKFVDTPRKAGMSWAPDLGGYLQTTSTGVTMVRIPVRFLKINNDIVIWAAPLELFCEIAMDVRDHSPFPFTFYFGYANGWLGYLPTKEEFAQGGYEPGVSPYTDAAGVDLAHAVLTYLVGEAQ